MTSVQQLKTFIEAVEFLADSPDWVPNERQWKKIREMIESIPTDVPQQVAPAPQQVYQQAYPQQPMAPVQYGGHSQLDAVLASQQAVPQRAAPMSSGAMSKTPDIDTSRGPYQSWFA